MSGRHDRDRAAAPAYRWVVLAVGVVAQAAFSAVSTGLPALAPALRAHYGLSIAEVGVALAAVVAGMVTTMLGWGVLADRVGERRVMTVGLVGAAGAMLLASRAGGPAPLIAALAVAGAFGASVNAASGRAVAGWFPPAERGVAMGVRQSALPLGGALAAASLPAIAGAEDAPRALAVLAAGCAAGALAALAGMRDPDGRSAAGATQARDANAGARAGPAEQAGMAALRAEATGRAPEPGPTSDAGPGAHGGTRATVRPTQQGHATDPGPTADAHLVTQAARGGDAGPAGGGPGADVGPHPLRDARIWRLTAASFALVVPQLALLSFVALYLHDERGLSPVAAGAVLAGAQITGAACRVAVGLGADRLGSRLRLLRGLVLAFAAALVAGTLLLPTPPAVAATGLTLAAVLSLSWNGLAFLAVAETAPPSRRGTALGLQNTAVAVAGSVAPVGFGLTVAAAGWTAAFGLLPLGPVLAFAVLAPLARAERRRSPTAPAPAERGPAQPERPPAGAEAPPARADAPPARAEAPPARADAPPARAGTPALPPAPVPPGARCP